MKISMQQATTTKRARSRLSATLLALAAYLAIVAIVAPVSAQEGGAPKIQKLEVMKSPTLLTAKAASAVACSTMVQDHLAWIQQNPGLHQGSHVVGAKMAAVKIRSTNPDTYPWGHGSYSEGRVGYGGDKLTGRFKVLFSDRKSPDGKYRFSPDKADLQDVTLFADGRVRVILQSWGSATLFLQDVRCFAGGFLTGIKSEGNGTSLVSIAIRKERIRPNDGFRDWP